MAIITTRWDIGDFVNIIAPGIKAQVVGIRYTGFTTLYLCLYWRDGHSEHYEAYDYELEFI